MSAASTAISVPVDTDTPISALVSAGASFIPSPTIITLPCFWSFLITVSLPSGRTPAMTSSTPAVLPIAFAVRSLSPVSMITLSPSVLSSLTASAESGLNESAAATMPIYLSSEAKNIGVFPSSETLFTASSREEGSFAPIIPALPARYKVPPIFPVTPLPGSTLNSSTDRALIPLDLQ